MTARATVGEIQLQLESVDYSGHNRIDRSRSEDGKVKEVIIGVGNGQFMWVYGESEFPEPSETSTYPLRMLRWAAFSWVGSAVEIVCWYPIDCRAHEKHRH